MFTSQPNPSVPAKAVTLVPNGQPYTQRMLRGLMSLLLLLSAFLLLSTKGSGQTTYDWFDTAPDGNWRQGAAGARWTGGLFDEPPFGILRFNNNHQLTMTNNVGGNDVRFMRL
jgi:hypothetical protein